MRLIDADKIKWRPTVHTIGLGIPEGQAYFVRKADIDDMPTVEAEPIRHGHWIEYNMYGELRYKCSVCGAVKLFRTFYCCECGAKMDEKENEE